MESWLRSLRLEQYGFKFSSAGFYTLDDCARITEPDLINMDILPGHRKRILINRPIPSAPAHLSDDDAVYQNVPSMDSDPYVPSNNCVPPQSVYDTPAQSKDDTYDVPVPRPRTSGAGQKSTESASSSDEEYYVNVHELNEGKKLASPSPPRLPPKKRDSKRDSCLDEMLGILPQQHLEAGVKKPVPAPRKGGGKRISHPPIIDSHLGVSLDSALAEVNDAEQLEPTPKPVPKPRPRKQKSVSSIHSMSEESNQVENIDDDRASRKSSSDHSLPCSTDQTGHYSSPRSSGSIKDTTEPRYDPEVDQAMEVLDGVINNIGPGEEGNYENDIEDNDSDDYPRLIPNGELRPEPPKHQVVDFSIYEPVGEPDILTETPLSLTWGSKRDVNDNRTDPDGQTGVSLESESGYGLVWGGPGMLPAASEKETPPIQQRAYVMDSRSDEEEEPNDSKTTPALFIPPPFLPWEPSASRDSTISFNAPPPSFTPPPLPDHVRHPDYPREQHIAKPAPGPPMLRPLSEVAPPSIPPRPKIYTPSKSNASSSESPSSASPQSGALLRENSFSSVTPPPRIPGPLPPIPRQEPAQVSDSTAVYDTPADAIPQALLQDPFESEYSEVAPPSPSTPHPHLPRDSSHSFSDLALRNRPEGGASVLNTSTQSEPEKPSRSQQPPTPHRLSSQVSEENIYVDEPVKIQKPQGHPALPPDPPPRYSKPSKDLFPPDETDEPSEGASACRKNLAELESDDTLSDGGEFLESELRHLRPSVLQNSIPIVPATPTTLKERKGYLHKLPSRHHQKRMGWRKRWVVFDGEELAYYSTEKSMISKRIIPVCTIVNVEQQIKMNELHPYEFKLTTLDRIYRFAAEDGDNLALWTSILMRAIIDTKPEKFEEGGSMCRPDKEGFVRMEGLKGRQYLVIKKDKFCYYNTFSDYKVGTPIHRVDLQLASVKDAGKLKLLLMTPRVSFGLLCESEAELSSWKEAFEEGIADGLGDDTILNEVYENHSNKLCADCGAPDPHWASINLAITLCKQCAGIHRMLNAPISKVRSLRMDFKVWTPSLIQLLHTIGNDNSNNFWEWNSTEDDRIDSDADMSSRQDYILAKYRLRRFLKRHPFHFDQTALNEALCKSVQYGNILETLQALFSGADICCVSSMYGSENQMPLQLAKMARQTLQMEFLIQNGAEAASSDRLTFMPESETCCTQITMKGYLQKLQNNQRDYQRRWFTLERGVLSYYENEKSTVAKDSLERKEMMSIALSSDERYEYGFELSTTKAGGRVYTIAAENQEERHQWMVKLAKSFAPLPPETTEKIRDLDRGGIVFLREGATTDWQMTWIQVKGKTLYIFKKDEQQFEEVDLRKVTGISKFRQCGTQTLQRTDLCIETFDDGPPFVIDIPNRALYIQGDMRRETEAWYTVLQKASTESSGYLVDFQLTVDNVPVIVDKCINFISAHGLRIEGIYRLNGQHSKVGQLLEEFKINAQNVFLSLDIYTVHDVATALKRLFRTLEEPLLSSALFPKWLETASITDNGSKMQWYKYLLGELPRVHYATLKRLIVHIAQVAAFVTENKMSELNLASIFGPILMKVDKEAGLHSTGYGSTTQEIAVILDLVSNHQWLFEVKDDELEHERKIQEALEKIEKASRASQGDMDSAQAGDLLIGFYLNCKEGDVVTMKVPASMTTQEVLAFIDKKADLDPSLHWSIYEVICQEQLERPLHYQERVLDVSLRWSDWADDFSRDNYFLVKPNVVYDKVNLVFDPHFSLFNEFKFSDKKGFKKYYFEFSRCKLSYQKDTRAANPVGSWNIEDLVLYLGVESKRSPPTRWGVTFISASEKQQKNKESPFFGHSICCQSEEEMYRWLAAMLHAQHPEGLVPEGVPMGPSPHDPVLPVPVEGAMAGSAESSPKVKKSSFLQRLKYSRR